MAAQRLNVVIAGHVDHGKSTLIGRLLADTDSLPQGKLAAVKEYCAKTAKPFEYAFLLDALKDEQSQGITIESARIFFQADGRDYMFLDAPGHIEFIRNMVTGASHATAALLVLDAKEGICENSRRHAVMLSMLGIRQTAVLVNKMDLTGYDQERFQSIVEDFKVFLRGLELDGVCFVPVSGANGDNVTKLSERMPWYGGRTLLETLASFPAAASRVEKPFRMPVQDVYRFTEDGDSRRIVAGTVETGRLAVGDSLIFYPSGKSSTVKTIEGFPDPLSGSQAAGTATGFTMREQVYVRRGEVAARKGEPAPKTATRLAVSMFWLGREPLTTHKDYHLKLGTAKVRTQVESFARVLDSSTLTVLKDKDHVAQNEMTDCILHLEAPLAFDLPEDDDRLGRFVIVDGYEISGGGMIREALEDSSSGIRARVFKRNLKWQKGLITALEREEGYRQRASMILVTGSDDKSRKAVAKSLEVHLHQKGRFTYFLGIGSLLYGVDADIRSTTPNYAEDFRRLGEVANMLLDAGLILVVTARELSQTDVDIVLAAIDRSRVETVWVGPKPVTDFKYDLLVPEIAAGDAVAAIERHMTDRGILMSE